MIITDPQHAVRDLRQGKVVAIPTETVYGLAANAENDAAVQCIFALKKRPLNHPLIVHVAKNWDLSRFALDLPPYLPLLIEHFWPGPLTFVLKRNPKTVSDWVTGNQDTVAIRCPAHDLAQALLSDLNAPLVAPSANPFGKLSPTTAAHVQEGFAGMDFTILDGGRCAIGIESTIISALDPKGYTILREGIIHKKALDALLPEALCGAKASPKVSGQLKSHYQPHKKLYTFSNLNHLKAFQAACKEKLYIISFSPMVLDKRHDYHRLSPTVQGTAFELYECLRLADQSQAALILIELPPLEQAWMAIHDRLRKASAGDSLEKLALPLQG